MNESLKITDTDLQSAHILIIDDEASNIKLLEKILHVSGYNHTLSVQDPRQAIAAHQKHQSDLILLDINMPYIDGYGVMKQLQALEEKNPAPILILTAQHTQDFQLRALDSGARDYITKPFNVHELLSRVRNLLQAHYAQKFVDAQNEILDQKVKERTAELELAHQEINSSRLQIIHRLGRAAEYRDNETGLHIIRMSKIAALIYQAIGKEAAACELLLNAAPMHDIGKIGIPDHILLKKGSFTPPEWEIMKGHVQIGADILSGDDSDLLQMAHEIALSHHEKWDGSGYPKALQGKDIPLVGRVTALADVFDALTSARPYKKAWSVEEAVDYINEQNGTHFDPALVDVFMNLLPEIIAIREQHAEPEASETAITT